MIPKKIPTEKIFWNHVSRPAPDNFAMGGNMLC